MAGPTAGVALPGIPGDEQVAEVGAMIDSVSSLRKGNDFWVAATALIGGRYAGEGRPFILGFTRPEGEHGQDAARYAGVVEAAFGFRPALEVGFAAMCNGGQDHRILAELCLWAAERFGGAVDFGGLLLPPLPGELSARWFRGELPWDEVRPLHRRMVQGLPGKVVELSYEVTAERAWAGHLADAEFLRAWLEHPQFHMIK